MGAIILTAAEDARRITTGGALLPFRVLGAFDPVRLRKRELLTDGHI